MRDTLPRTKVKGPLLRKRYDSRQPRVGTGSFDNTDSLHHAPLGLTAAVTQEALNT